MITKAERVDALWDYAVEHPDGFTNVEVIKDLGLWKYLAEFNRTVRALRLALGEDEITLTCDPTEDGGPWLYRLVGTYEDARPWAVNRLGDTESRLETMEAVASAIVNATDGRTKDGHKARLIYSTVSYLREQLILMDADAE